MRDEAPVTGKERKMQLTPQMKALSDFYQALNDRDMELMTRNWAQSDESVMDNPVGGIKRGWDEIRAVYERIFSSPGQYWFEFYDYSYHEAGEIFYVVGRERGKYGAGEEALDMAIRTSRVFRWMDGEWRQVHHHGSIDDPVLLAAYQKAVRSDV
ncbi:MAG: nuclear transport factor 2 family protein [Geobacteraceae bacterium]|nr:nuclear transport factor 2 family protein [Geobacteraceae bacterium]